MPKCNKLLLATMILTLALTAGASSAQPADENPAETSPKLVEVSKPLGEGPAKEQAPLTPNQSPTTQAAGRQASQSPWERLRSGGGFYIVMIGGLILLFFWTSRGKRKQEAKRKEMLSSLKKGDKVTSIGGIVGTIMEVREDEVAVKVDENNNIRMKFARWAIRGVGEEAKTETPKGGR